MRSIEIIFHPDVTFTSEMLDAIDERLPQLLIELVDSQVAVEDPWMICSGPLTGAKLRRARKLFERR